MIKGHIGWKHLKASLRDKIAILAKDPRRLSIYPNVWVLSCLGRIESEEEENFELCACILKFQIVLTSKHLAV